jgi:hypothetical protein
MIPLLLAAALAEEPAQEGAAKEGSSGAPASGDTAAESTPAPAGGTPSADPRDALFGAPAADPRDDVFGAPPADTRDDVFGAPDGGTQSEAPPSTGNRDDDLLSGGDVSRAGSILDTLEALDQRVTIGGRLYLRANVGVDEEDAFEDVDLSSPNFLDLYVDARPNDRIRGYVQGRLSHSLSAQEGDTDWLGEEITPTTVKLDQFWLNFDIGRRVYVTAGRQRVKWGIGRFWNPTDFLQPARLDPLAFFDERTGVGLIKVHVPFEKTGTNIYAFADVEGADALDQVGGALRVEQVVGLTEVAVSASVGKDRPTRLGAQVSTGVWLFDLRAEAAFTNGLTTKFYRGNFDWGPLDENGFASLFTIETPKEYSREDDWIPQVVAGLELPIKYNDEDSLYLGAEYFWNDAGYEDASLYPWLLFNNAFTPFYVGQHYAGVYLFVPAPGRLDDHNFTLSTLGNLSDKSFTSRVDWSVRALTFLSINAYASTSYGEYGELRLALDVPPLLGVTEEGTTLHAPLVDVGVGAQITF